jgi:hypothetical protein
MTDQPDGPAVHEFDPGSMATSSFGTTKALWYKRPWVLVTFVLVVVVGVSIVTDLPHHITPAQDVGDQNAALHQINFDLRTCNYSLNEAFKFYRLDVEQKLSTSNFNLSLNTYLPQDQQSCSFLSSALTDMTGNLQIVDTAAGKQIEKMRLTVVRWIDHDAQDAIKDIIFLFTHPGDAKTLHNLSVQENYLVQDRQLALNYLNSAQNLLGVTLVNLNLSVPARLAGT